MISPRYVIAFLCVAFLSHCAKQAVVSKKSKLCSNSACDEVLFKTRVKRVMGINSDPSFLKLVENSFISVTAVKFSDRPDIMEGRLNDEGAIGFFYAGAIDTLPFAEFLRTAIDEKKDMLMVSQDPADTGDKRVVGVVHSDTDLIRDYNARNTQAAAEHGLPAPTPLPIPEPTGGHGHSHGGHGHSHGGHGHSHGGHGHSHSPPTTTAAPPTLPTPAPEAEKPKEEPEINLNNVLGTPSLTETVGKIDLQDMEAEIERMIREEEERMKNKEEVTQPPLVLSSLPAQETEQVPTTTPAPEIVPEVVTTTTPVPDVVPEVVTTTTAAPEVVAEVVPEVVTTPAPIVEEPVTTTTPAPEIVAEVIPEVVTTTTPVPEVAEVVTPPTIEEPTTTLAPEVLPQEPIAQFIPPVETIPEVVSTTTPAPVEDTTGVCYKDNECHGLQDQKEQKPEDEDFKKWEEERKKRETAQPYEDADNRRFSDLPLPPPTSSGLIEFVRSSFGFGNVTDGTVLLYLNVTFVVASLVLYLIVRTLSGGSDSDVLDRQAYFNLVTKHKQLELQLQAKQAEIQNLQSAGVQQQHHQQQQIPNHEPELAALRQQVNQLHSELQIAQSQRQEFEVHCNQLREISEQKEQQIVALNSALSDYQERLERSTNEVQDWARQLDAARAELNESQQSAASRQQELVSQQQVHDATHNKIEELTAETRELQSRIRQLQDANDQLEVELKDVKMENSGLLNTVEQLEIEKSQNEVEAESGGSGWSDFGEMDEVEEKKTPETTTYKQVGENLEEINTLKKKLEEAEKELSKYKALYEKEEKLKTDYEHKLNNYESESKKRVEELAAEKKELGDRLNETVKTLNNTINKSSDADKVVATLREEGFAKDKQLLEVDSVMRKKDEKIRELDAEFKRVQREYTKLETKSFHDVMKLKKELDDYKTSQILGSQNISREMFTSADLRSDRQLASPLEDPIWDEPDYVQQQQQPLQQEDYFSSGSMPSKRRSSRRSDHRMLGEMSPSDREVPSLKKKEGGVHRRRSRSHGRQMPAFADPYAMAYLPGSSDSSFMSQGFQPLSGRHSKSGHLHYSSGGSNGGRSPPPEMPLLSAIPPPGARKPTSKRLDPSLHGK